MARNWKKTSNKRFLNMPGLPRKSTVKQFKKLMRKSGKSRTNKAVGGCDPSTKKIATYEQYFAMKESVIKWYSDGKFTEDEEIVDYNLKVGDRVIYNREDSKYNESLFEIVKVRRDGRLDLSHLRSAVKLLRIPPEYVRKIKNTNLSFEDSQIGDIVATKSGELFGKVIDKTEDSITIKTVLSDSEYTLSDYKFNAYKFKKL